MKRYFNVLLLFPLAFLLIACSPSSGDPGSVEAESRTVRAQQNQYSIAQPIPTFDWSLERDLVIQLYEIRNQRVATHSVWRSDYGMIEGDCASIGYGLPYDTSLTNPLVADWHRWADGGGVAVEQPEPNGVFASKNTTATFVMCLSDAGTVAPVYVESKVTTYPYPVDVDYETNRVVSAGQATVNINVAD